MQTALALLLAASALASHPADQARWKAEAARVTIARDDWGIAHVKGRTDADAVFGAIYAQAEDDFNRIEMNYLTALGRTAEAEGEEAIWQDLRQRLWTDPADLKARYAGSPAWLKRLMDAWADGLNFYLASHPQVHPKVLTRFEPWMALSFTEGSIGGDIERVSLADLKAFYGNGPKVAEAELPMPKEPSGSNGIAIAPKDSASGHALLLINPHTSFFFRSELQMTSDEGLNAYGASTWGQFFIYQGFNPHIGWMHTSSGVDVVDEFAETIVRGGNGMSYRYGKALRPVTAKRITLRYRKPDGSFGERSFKTYATHHGPIVRAEGEKWIAFALMNRPIPALEQSWLRTKATELASFMKVAELKANSSNNTIFADDKGEIAYLHPQFIPKRDDRFDYTKPVDGSDPAIDWQGLLPLSAAPQVVSPSVGWVQNTNTGPWWAAGPDSPKQAAFPRYMDTAGQNARGEHALKLLTERHGFSLDSLIGAAFDPWLPAFARLIPTLTAALDEQSPFDPLAVKLVEPVALLKTWDYRWSAASEPTTLAVFWGDEMGKKVPGFTKGSWTTFERAIASTSPRQKLEALAAAVDRLQADFGRWRVPWGEVNRFQRLDDSIEPHFSDAAPSIPVPFTSGGWGSLASFGAKQYPNTKKWYGSFGNSFVAAIEFGPRVRARAVTAGGESGDPKSPHFRDEAERYASGNLREVYFWPDQLKGHTERVYRPGQ